VVHLRDADYLSRMNVPHELSDRNLQQCLDACNLLEKNKVFFEEDDHWERKMDCVQ